MWLWLWRARRAAGANTGYPNRTRNVPVRPIHPTLSGPISQGNADPSERPVILGTSTFLSAHGPKSCFHSTVAHLILKALRVDFPLKPVHKAKQVQYPIAGHRTRPATKEAISRRPSGGREHGGRWKAQTSACRSLLRALYGSVGPFALSGNGCRNSARALGHWG